MRSPPSATGADAGCHRLRSRRHAAARPHRFLLETLHRDSLTARFRPQLEYTTSSGARVRRDYRWDLARDVIDDRVSIVRPDGSRAEYASSLRVRTLHQLLGLARAAGLEPLAWYGGLDGSTLELASRRLVLISARSAASAAPPPTRPKRRVRRRA